MKPVQIMHTADLHLGYRQYGFALREGDFYKAAQQVFEKAVEYRVDAILFAGDIFDSAKPSATAVWVMQELVKFAKSKGIMVLGIDGNHDSSDSNWLRICGIEPLNGDVLLVHGISVAGINATRPTQFYQQVAALAERKEPIQVIAIHQAVAELCDFPVQDFTALQMATVLKPLGVEYVAMGDIHVYRETVLGGIRFAYSGSTEVNAIDEPVDKSVSIVKFEDGKMSTAMIPLKTRPFLVCQLESDADVDSLLAKTAAADPPFIVGWYSAEKRDIAKRAEELLRNAGVMYRIMPYAGEAGAKHLTASFERKGAMLQLKDAVAAFFEENMEEYELVFQLLGAPDDTKGIMQRYMKSKGL